MVEALAAWAELLPAWAQAPAAWALASADWLLPLAVGISALTVTATLVGLPVVLTRLPEDWFLHPPPPHPGRKLAKNLLGGLLVFAGVLMLVLPGQGLLTILAGLVVSEFPRKRELELALLRRGPVRAAVDALRRRAGAPPLRLP